jgi:hypothetical protein
MADGPCWSLPEIGQVFARQARKGVPFLKEPDFTGKTGSQNFPCLKSIEVRKWDCRDSKGRLRTDAINGERRRSID